MMISSAGPDLSSASPSPSLSSSSSSSSSLCRRLTSPEEIAQAAQWCLKQRAWKLHAHLDELSRTDRISGDQGYSDKASPVLFVNSTSAAFPSDDNKLELQVEVVLLFYGSGNIETVLDRARHPYHNQSQQAQSPATGGASDSSPFYVTFETTRSHESIHQLKLMLQELLPTHEQFYFSGISDVYDEMIKQLASSHDATLEWDLSSEWCATAASRASAIAQATPREGSSFTAPAASSDQSSSSLQITVGALRAEHVDLVVRNWAYSTASTPGLIRYLIESGKTSAVYQQGKPVSYCLQQSYGAIGMLFTDPVYRHQGLASLCVSALCEQILRSHPSQTLFAYIADDNTSSERVFSKQGFNKLGKIRWILWNPSSVSKGGVPKVKDNRDRKCESMSSSSQPSLPSQSNNTKPVAENIQQSVANKKSKKSRSSAVSNKGNGVPVKATNNASDKRLIKEPKAVKTVCKFALHPRKCRYGNKCRFAASHVQSGSAALPSTSTELNSSSPEHQKVELAEVDIPPPSVKHNASSSTIQSKSNGNKLERKQKKPKKLKSGALLDASAVVPASSISQPSSSQPKPVVKPLPKQPTAEERLATQMAEQEELQRQFTQEILHASSAANEQFYSSLSQIQSQTSKIIEEVQSKAQAELSLLEKSPVVVQDLIFSVLDIQSLLQIGQCSKSLWVSIATRSEMWRICAIAPPRYNAIITEHRSNAIGRVWSLFGRHNGLVVQWPPAWSPASQKKSQALKELQAFLKLVPLSLQPNSRKHGFALNFGRVQMDPASRYSSRSEGVPFLRSSLLAETQTSHALLESELMWECAFSSHLAQGLGELYLSELNVTVHMMSILSNLPMLHTLSLTEESRDDTSENSLLQYLPNMKRLTSLHYTGHLQRPLQAPTCRFVARCPTLQRMHLRLLSHLGPEQQDWFTSFYHSLASSSISELGVEYVKSANMPFYSVVDALDVVTRIAEPDSSSSISEPVSWLQGPKVIHLFNVRWPMAAISQRLAGMLNQVMNHSCSDELNEIDIPYQRKELHLHVLDSGVDFNHFMRDTIDASAQSLRELLAATQSACQLHLYIPNSTGPQRVPEHLQLREWHQMRALYFPSPLEAAALEVACEPASKSRLHVWDHPLLPLSFVQGNWQGPGRASADSRKMEQNRPRMIKQLEKNSALWKCYLHEAAERRKKAEQYAYKKALQSRVDNLCSQLNSTSRLDSRVHTFQMHVLVPKITVQCGGEEDHFLSFRLQGGVTLEELRLLLVDLTELSSERLELRLLNPPQAPITEEHNALTISDLRFEGRIVSFFPSIKRMIPRPTTSLTTYDSGMIQADIKKLLRSYTSTATTLRSLRLSAEQQCDVAVQLLRVGVPSDHLVSLLQCLIYDEVLTSESIIAGMRKSRANINVEQRSAILRRDIVNGDATNLHVRLNEKVALFRQYRRSLGFHEEDLDEIMKLEEQMPRAKDSRLDKIVYDYESKLKKLRSSQEQWRTYRDLSSTVAHPEYRSANRIFNVDSRLSSAHSSVAEQRNEQSFASSSTSSATIPGHKHLLTVFSTNVRDIPVATLKLISTILEKLKSSLASSEENSEKYRRIRLTQEKVSTMIVGVPGALDLLIAAGFERSYDGEVLLFPEGASLELANSAITLLQPFIQTAAAVMPASGESGSSSSITIDNLSQLPQS